ncbi:hypothetical protein BDN72DRAFT_845804 [Pluteus cervinus]|uniref:Uncharacterized protein n=1 Tax=Pluteus cervinus TaxID=181527 RepID=A0ACD3AI86_9AGAR|nr:hypothetical protein BDN72DRAFT_845804 [Pluteus cervinus]
MDNSEPFLPPELERHIFLYALNHSREDAQNLLSVAKRVENWLIPVVYEVVGFHTTYSTPFPFEMQRYERYGKETRHLAVGVEEMIPSLSFFPNVTNLAIWSRYDELLVTFLEKSSLTRLSIRLHSFDPPTPRLIQTFSRITHLEVVGRLDSWKDCHLLDHFTSLTHLCVLWDTYKNLLEEMLGRYPSLAILILWDWNPIDPEDSGDTPTIALSPLGDRDFNDIRVIAVRNRFIEDWETGARGGIDMWRFADNVMAERKREKPS